MSDQYSDSLRVHFADLGLTDSASDWLIMLWDAIQVFDDFVDGDPVPRKAVDNAIWNTLVGMNQNEFWAQNSAHLAAAVSVMVLKWQASDAEERAGRADAISYVWRAGYYDIVLLCVMLCCGPTQAHDSCVKVMRLYGETLDDYLKEFFPCQTL